MKSRVIPHIHLTKEAPTGSYPYTHTGIQQLIGDLLDIYGLSAFELAKRGGLTPSALYTILKRKERDVSRPPRRSTIQGLAAAIGGTVTFDSAEGLIWFRHPSVPETKDDSITQFLLQVADVLKQSGRREIPREEGDKILRVLKVLL